MRPYSSPQISHFEWGRVEAAGRSFKDAKLYPGGVREWDWNETGTRHEPGIQTTDVDELLEHGASVVVLSKGINKRLQVPAETVAYLEERGVDVEVLQTEAAVKRYNELSRRVPVGALIHSTC